MTLIEDAIRIGDTVRHAIVIGCATVCLACSGVVDGPPRSGNVEEWELAEDLRLDAITEDFSVVPWFAVGPQGEIVVPEPQDFRLRLYDSTGTTVAVVGRQGEGPGEFRHVGLSIWAADTLVVVDARLGRETYFLPDGRLARTGTARFFFPSLEAYGPQGADSTFVAFAPLAVDEEGAQLGVAHQLTTTDGTWESEFVILRVNRDGEPRVLAVPPQYDDERWAVTVSGVTNPVPFAFQPLIEFAPDGSRFLFATADQSTLAGGTHSLTMLRPTGDTVFARSYAYAGEPIPDSVLDRAIARIAPESGFGRRARSLARQRAPMVYGPNDVTLGLDGTVWIELRSTDRGTPVTVISETGDVIGTLLLPPRSKIQEASMTHLWVRETDALDLVSVVRYRVTHPPRVSSSSTTRSTSNASRVTPSTWPAPISSTSTSAGIATRARNRPSVSYT